MEENIDVALNRKIHTTTLERFCDLIEQFMVDFADRQAEEKKIKPSPLIDLNKELEAINEYVSRTWNGFDKVDASAFFSKIWSHVTQLTTHQFENNDFYKVTEILLDEKSSDKLLNNKELHSLGSGVLIGAMRLSNMLRDNWDYQDNVSNILSDVNKEFPDAVKLKPKGWAKMAKHYQGYQGMEELDEGALGFTGADSSTAGTYSFHIRVALPHVMYDDKCQGIKPLEVLIGAMLGHAYVINQKNNNSKMLTEWDEVIGKIKKSNSVQHEFKEPLNKVLYSMIETQDFSANNTKVIELLGIKSETKKLKM